MTPPTGSTTFDKPYTVHIPSLQCFKMQLQLLSGGNNFCMQQEGSWNSLSVSITPLSGNLMMKVSQHCNTPLVMRSTLSLVRLESQLQFNPNPPMICIRPWVFWKIHQEYMQMSMNIFDKNQKIGKIVFTTSTLLAKKACYFIPVSISPVYGII